MTIINTVSNTRFSFNGIEYFKNYISVVRGNRIEIFNCYEREDVLLPLTSYSAITLNGIIYNSAADLQSALQSVSYSRATLGGDAVEITEQNNIGKVINIGYLSNSNFTSQVISKINSLTTVLTAVDNPVFFEAFKTGSSLASSAQKVRFQFMGGKGTWGVDGTTVGPSHLYQNAPEAVILDDIANDANGITLNIGQLTNENNFIEVVNSATRDFTDIKKNHYINYAIDDVTFVKKFSGTPGEYGNEDTFFTSNDFIDVTNSKIERGLFTPTLKDITNIDPETDIPVTITDNNTGNKTTITGSKIVHTDIDGNTTSISYQANPNNVEYTIPAKSNDVFAMQSDVNGLSITANQSAGELYLKNAEGSTLATINVGFLNNEGTTFFYNGTSQNLELKNDEGDILSEVPVSAFVSNLMQTVNFNAATPPVLEFKDAEGNVVDSVQITISNIQGLQSALNGKFNNPIGVSTQYIRGDGTISNFRDAVRNTDLNGLSTSSQAPITATDNVLSAFGKVQGQLNKAAYNFGIVNGDLNTLYTLGTGYFLSEQAPANAPEVLSGRWVVNQFVAPSGGYGFQIASYATSSNESKRVYYRHGGTTGFGPWYRLWNNGDFSSSDIDKWNTAYARGDFREYGLGTSTPVPFPASDLNDITVPNGFYYASGAALNTPITNSGALLIERISTGTPYITQKYQAINTGDTIRMFIRHYKPSSGTWTPWRELWTSENLTQADIDKWNTAYARGNFREYGLGEEILQVTDLTSTEANASRIFRFLSSATGSGGFGGAVISMRFDGTPATMFLGANSAYAFVGSKVGANAAPSFHKLWDTRAFSQNDIDDWNAMASTTIALTGKVLGTPSAILGNGNIEIPVTEIKELTFYDTRDIESPPSFYYGKKMVGEFKRATIVNNPPVVSTTSTYCHIITIAGYEDATGGRPTQLSVGPQGIAMRTATDDSTWGNWKRLWHDGDFTNNDITKWNNYESNKADLIDGKVSPTQLPVYEVEDISGLQAALDSKAEVENTLTYKGLMPLNSDFDLYNTTGIYVPQDADTCINCPTAYPGKLEVVIDVSDNIYQTYHGDRNDVYTRTYQDNGSTWTTWEKLAKASNIIVNNSLTTEQTNASLNALYSDKPVSFMLAAPNVDKGKLFIKTSGTKWLMFSGDLLLD